MSTILFKMMPYRLVLNRTREMIYDYQIESKIILVM